MCNLEIPVPVSIFIRYGQNHGQIVESHFQDFQELRSPSNFHASPVLPPILSQPHSLYVVVIVGRHV